MLLSVAFFFAIEVVVQIISGIALIAGLPALDNLFFWANTNLPRQGHPRVHVGLHRLTPPSLPWSSTA